MTLVIAESPRKRQTRRMKNLFLVAVLGLSSLTACGDDDNGGGSGGTSSGGASTGGSAGSGGTSSGGSAGSGGTSSGGNAGSGGTSSGGNAGSGGTSSGGNAGSGGTSSGGTSSGGTGGSSACNTLVNDGADIVEEAATGTPPAMTGGTISDGTYVLTARKDWQGSCNCTSRQKLAISGGTVQIVARTDKAADQHMTATAAVAGNQLTLSGTCPVAQSLKQTYTATATQLSLFDASDQSLKVYTKQ